jgi:pyruvate,water dikinase
MIRLRLVLFVFFITSVSIVTGQKSATNLSDKSDFDGFSGLPLTGKYGQVSALKIVLSLDNERLYFINSNHFKYHHEFCAVQLGGTSDLTHFNELNYSNSKKRKYLLANINYYSSLGIYALEISPADLMSIDDIVKLYKSVLVHSYFAKELHFFLNTSRLSNQKNTLKKYFPLLEPAEVYGSLMYQAVSKYKKEGVLKFINDLESEKDQILPSDIIVINETPLVLPQVSGIIVTEFQTPLSHLSILGQNRKIPIMAYKEAFDDHNLINLKEQTIQLEVKSDTFFIKRIGAIKSTRESKSRIKLKFDLEVDSLVDIEYLSKKSFRYAGNKASNFAILEKLSLKNDFRVPEGAFVIPFSFYQKHIENTGLDSLFSLLSFDKEKKIETDSIKSTLKRIRKRINRVSLDAVLLENVKTKVKGNPEFERYRFRSSTNAEDAKGFSGAGLYKSKTGVINKAGSIEKAIKKVWASLWSYKAFAERDYFNIDHSMVFMGILVHRSFPDEDVNGVAITKNIYREGSPGFVVNAQLGDESVVKPKPGIICDQFICYTTLDDNVYTSKNTIDIISLSNLNNNQLVMTEYEIQHLADQLEHIKRKIIKVERGTEKYFNQGLDVEFKLDGDDRALYIKQVRIYND